MNNLIFSKHDEYHEGLTFDYISSLRVVEFLQNNELIKNDLFEFNCCVEEFALQTISLNLTGYYYQIGNCTGPWEDDYDNYMKINQRRVYDKEYYAFDDIKNGGTNNKSKKQNNRFKKTN